MRTSRPGRGDTKLGCLLWLLGLGFAAYIGWQAVPAQIKASELKKTMAGLAEHSAEDPIEKIRARVLVRVKDLGLPVDKKALDVKRTGGRIKISYRYSLPINLVVTTYDWSFDVGVDRLIIIV